MRQKFLSVSFLLLFALSFGLQPASALASHPPASPVLIPPPSNSLLFPAAASQHILVYDPNGDPLEVTFYTRPAANRGENFSIAVLPDTQYYSYNYPEIFTSQTEWIVNHQSEYDIQAVIHLGDVVETNDASYQWENAFASMSLLEAIPHGVAVGNHDQSPNGDSQGSTDNFNTYFGVNRFAPWSYYGGHYGDNNDNSYFFFSAGEFDFVVILLEYSLIPQPDVMTWADAILHAYPDRFGIVVSHALIDLMGNWLNRGEVFYETFKDNPNLILMLCGHFPGEGYRIDEYGQHSFYTVLADYQWLPEPESGFLRLLHFQPALGLLQVRTYSPYIDQYRTGPTSEFILPVDLRPAFTPQATLRDVPSGADLRMDFTGLDLSQSYEWYVTVNDGQNVVTGPTWLFKVGLPYQLSMPFILNDANFRAGTLLRMPEWRFRHLIAE